MVDFVDLHVHIDLVIPPMSLLLLNQVVIKLIICLFPTIVIREPSDTTICAEQEATFSCVFNTTDNSINSNDVQWYRLVKDTGTTQLVDQNDMIAIFISSDNDLNTTLAITDARIFHTGYYWVGIPSFNVCNVSLTVVASMTCTI